MNETTLKDILDVLATQTEQMNKVFENGFPVNFVEEQIIKYDLYLKINSSYRIKNKDFDFEKSGYKISFFNTEAWLSSVHDGYNNLYEKTLYGLRFYKKSNSQKKNAHLDDFNFILYIPTKHACIENDKFNKELFIKNVCIGTWCKLKNSLIFDTRAQYQGSNYTIKSPTTTYYEILFNVSEFLDLDVLNLYSKLENKINDISNKYFKELCMLNSFKYNEPINEIFKNELLKDEDYEYFQMLLDKEKPIFFDFNVLENRILKN